MNKLVLIIIVFFINSLLHAQEGLFKSGFIFKNDNFNEIYEITKNAKVNLKKRTIHSKLVGIITKRNEDTLFIKFWDITRDTNLPTDNNSNIITSADNKKKFFFLLKSDDWSGKNCHFDIPYKFNQLIATNIPFRAILNGSRKGEVEAEFLNANASFVMIRGSTRIFDNEFVKSRSRYWAWGPYLGLTAITNNESDKKEFGLNGGVNLMAGIQGLNTVLAFGAQRGFTSGTKDLEFYFGFGIGFKLFEMFSPEIKNKGDDD